VWGQEEAREFAGIIDDEADKLTDIIDHLLDISRLQAGKFSVDVQAVSIHTILETILPELFSLCDDHRLVVNAATNLPLILADPKRIGQVLTNLVSNAAKYSPAQTL